MKKLLRRALSLFLAASLLSAAGVTAAASDALGEDLTAQDTLLNQDTELSTNVFWSSAYSDLRTENRITYTPNEDVTPIVTYGDTMTSLRTTSAISRQLEEAGYRVVAGLNGDFFNVGTGLPIGLVVSQGKLLSSDGGYYAIGFRADGTAVLGKPGVKVSADLGYELADESGYTTRVVRQLAGVNKARVSSGGIYLYTYEFNAKHTTGNTEPGVDVLCTVEEGDLAIGETVTLTVEEVREATSATDIQPDQVVLSANLQSAPYYVDALRNIPVGTSVTLTAAAADSQWDDVEYAVGALYSLVEQGSVVSGLPAGTSPRTAVGQRSDGSLVFYTIDGRRSGHSIGASMSQVGQRMVELGCETALCLDGGGSTTLTVTQPDDTVAQTVNTPSDGRERAVSNHIFLVASSEPSDRLHHFYVQADAPYVLAGSRVNISASAVDTHFIPMDSRYELETDHGELDGNTLLTPEYDCEITVTAQGGGKEGSTTVWAVETPDTIAIRGADNNVLSAVNAAPGSSVSLKATAAYKHRPLKADAEVFRWSVSGEIGTISSDGVFTATAPGSGTITVSAGGTSATIPVTVSKLALQTVEDFESGFTPVSGANASLEWNRSADTVRFGKASAKLTYDAAAGLAMLPLPTAYSLPAGYSTLLFWVRGDNSGSVLAAEITASDEEGGLTTRLVDAATLNFSGWQQVALPLASGETLTGLCVHGPAYLDENGAQAYSPAPAGTLYLDQLVASFGTTADNRVPAVSAALDQAGWAVTAEVLDETDGVLPKSAVAVTYNGAPMDFSYDASTGRVSVALPGPGETHEAMRVTVTARDGSGNIGRASVDVDALNVEHKFTDTQDYWAATYVDFLYNAGITTGYEDGTFRPNQSITRAQFSVMLYRYLGLKEADYADVTLPFADLDAIPAYALPAIRALYTEGIINGTAGAGGRLYFHPGDPLTRAQAATMIGRTQPKGYASGELSFTDAGRIPGYAGDYIRTMAAQGVISGYADGTFQPGKNITRGQMAKILYTLM